tara:strand:- start:848093 stop:849175 length:1083 start_codon:yes stop_codon:yes gene_type:complete
MTKLFDFFDKLRNGKIDIDAANILSCAAQSSMKIMEYRAEIDKQGKIDQPLYVPVGEDHTMVSHYLHNIYMLKILQKAEENLVVGLELPHNELEDMVGRNISAENQATFNNLVDNKYNDAVAYNAASIHFATELFVTRSAKLSNQNIFTFLSDSQVKGHLKVFFSDAVSISRRILDLEDRDTSVSVREYFSKQGLTVPADNDLINQMKSNRTIAVNIRNHHMWKTLTSFSEEQNSRISILRCGRAHVGGYTHEVLTDQDPEKSLSALFEKAGQATLPIHLGGNMRGSHVHDKQIVHSDLPLKRAMYDTSTGRLSWFNKEDLKTRCLYIGAFTSERAERQYIDRVSARMDVMMAKFAAPSL